MKRILSILLISVALLCAAYFLLIDRALKTVIETQGSSALMAKLDVAHVTFHLFPTSIRLEGVQVTNAQQPLRNLVEIRALTTPLSIGAMIDRKIDIPSMEVNGLRFNTARAQSGAIGNLTHDLTGEPAAADSGATALPDANQQARQQNQTLQDELNKTKLDLTAILNRWQQQLQQLPDDNQIEAYRQRAFVLQSANNTAGLTALRQELNNQLGSARKLFDEFTVDMQRTREQFSYARTLPQSGVATISATPQALNNITGALLGEQFKPLLLTITQQINRLSSSGNSAAPALLIRNIALDGQLDLGTQPLLFTGTLANLTPQPRLWDVATSFTLAGVAGQPSQFNARGAIDLRKTANVDIRFDLRQFPLREFPLSKNPRLTIVIEQAQTDIQGLLSLTGNQIDINLLSHFQQ
ncbi:MAG TPA: AsmA family protein, partial [Spongiibacteraceae bacterium]|nr:AsmA family protein [Spongiibacteraceae bacterium]